MINDRTEEERHHRCLNCGKEIYGRTDKKFCSANCKNEYSYRMKGSSINIRNRVLRALYKNYRILDNLFESGAMNVELREIEDLGFNPSYITGIRRTRGRYDEYSCFDLRYCKTENRLFNIRKCNDF